MSTPAPNLRAVPGGGQDKTWSVSEVLGGIDRAVRAAFAAPVWVSGTWTGRKQLRNGTISAELVEHDSADRVVASIPVLLDTEVQHALRGPMVESGVKLTEGTKVRVRGRLGRWRGRSQLHVTITDIDIEWTLAAAEIARDRLISDLRAAGVLDRNGKLAWPEVPLRVGLIGSVGTAGWSDFVDQLRSSGLRFEVLAVDTKVQGADAAQHVKRNIEQLAAYTAKRSWKPDVCAIVRGGGATGDLAAFDERAVAEAIAAAPWPILSGIGHQTDETIADLAAHTSVKTPTAAAQHLIGSVNEWFGKLDAVVNSTLSAAHAGVISLTERQRARDETIANLTAAGLGRVAERLGEQHDRLWASIERDLAGSVRALTERQQRVSGLIDANLTAARDRNDATERHITAYHPQRVLERGFAIVRDTDGNVITDAETIAAGEAIAVTVAAGTIDATVIETGATR